MLDLLESPEFRLLVACCRWPPAPARDASVREACSGVADWAGAVWLAQRHRVAGLVYEASLSSAGKIPERAMARLAAAARDIARRNLMLASESVRLHGLLGAAGIPNMSLKGVPLAQFVYDSVSTKHTRDIDILVPPDHAWRALQLLEADGYVLASPACNLNADQRQALVRFAREVEFVRPGAGIHVELQWRLSSNANLLQGIDATSPTQTVVLPGGPTLQTLTDDDLFAFLCVHGAHHLWSRLKWLVDLNAFIVRGGSATLMRHYRYAQARGAGLCAGQALLLCRDLLKLPLPAALSDELGADRRLPTLVSAARQVLADPVPDTAPGHGATRLMREAAVHFLYGRGWPFLLAQVRTQLVGAGEIVQVPLPRRLQFLYPLMRLPLWLSRRAAWAIAIGRPRGR